MNFSTYVTLIAAALLIAACAAGTDVVRPMEVKIQYGKTTKADIIGTMGMPFLKGSITRNGSAIDFVRYTPEAPHTGPLFEGVSPNKNISLFFFNGILVGADYASLFRDGHSQIDTEKAKTVREGMIGAEVIALLGKPSGEYRYPMTEKQEGRTLVYVYGQSLATKYQNSVLKAEMDGHDVIRKVKFAQTGAW